MKKISLLLFTLIMFSFSVKSQKLNDMIYLTKYKKENAALPAPRKGEKRVVFIGNSITENWVVGQPKFFTLNNYIGRGISGQTSPQILLRFRHDVVNLKPVAVVINAGINDIAENKGSYNPQFTLGNIKSMTEIAEANGIRVILSSVLPAASFRWNKEVKNVPAKIDALNKEIEAYAKSKNITYINYNFRMRDKNGAMKSTLSGDGVHPNAKGYSVMNGIAKPIIDRLLRNIPIGI